MHQLIPGNILWQSVQQASGFVLNIFGAHVAEYNLQVTTGQLNNQLFMEADCRIQLREDQEDKRAVARNCSFLSENFFILSITSSLVSLARGGRLVFGGVSRFFMASLSQKI